MHRAAPLLFGLVVTLALVTAFGFDIGFDLDRLRLDLDLVAMAFSLLATWLFAGIAYGTDLLGTTMSTPHEIGSDR